MKIKLDVYFRLSEGQCEAILLEPSTRELGSVTVVSEVWGHSNGCILWLYQNTKPAKKEDYDSTLKMMQRVYHEYDIQAKTRLPAYDKALSLLKKLR